MMRRAIVSIFDKILSSVQFFFRHLLTTCYHAALSVILPNRCVLCGLLCQQERTNLLCHHCLTLAPQQQRCPCCARVLPRTSSHDLTHSQLCGACLLTPPHFDHTLTVFDYQAPFDRLISRYKFQGQASWAKGLATLMNEAIKRDRDLVHNTSLPTLLVSVPLAPHRLQERGFNQAHEIARCLRPLLPCRYLPHAIWRTRDTVKQSWLKRQARQRNIKGIFEINSQVLNELTGAHIGVVDDVLTSGATLNEIARLLKQHGAQKVSNYVIARTPVH